MDPVFMSSKPVAVAISLVLLPCAVLAWSGDTWGNITRSTIKANADLMIDCTWTAKNSFTNFQYGSTYQDYTKGVTYTGVAYSQNNPQENWPEFRNLVTNTVGGLDVGYGNDCSGFASMCWRLTGRKTTYYFEQQLGTQWISLGEVGSAATTSLLLGDALNKASSHIILFWKYESGGIRSLEQTPDNAQRRLWSYSSLASYRPIRRLQITDAPTITTEAISRVVDAGNPVILSVAANGTGTLTYQWRLNGTNLPWARSSSLVLSAAQLTNGGDYVCVVGNGIGSVTSKVVSLTVHLPHTTTYFENFDVNSAANWTLNRSSTDTKATFAWDYSALGIPSAPHSTGGTTRGLKLEANMTAGAIAALSLSPKNHFFGGDYRLKFDMWINVNGPLPDGGTGSTEHVTGGIGTAGDRTQWTGNGSTADGYWFSVDGEGGAGDSSTTTGDFCAFIGPAIQNPGAGCYAAGVDSTAKGNEHTYYTAAFPTQSVPPALQRSAYAQQTGSLAAGTVGFSWREFMVARRGNTIEWSIDGVRLAALQNATLTASNIFVGYFDSYASISDNASLSFGLIDNVRVEVPTSALPRFVSSAVHNGRLEVEGTGTPGHYVIEKSADLLNWSEVTNMICTSASFRFSDTNCVGRGYYRVRMDTSR